MRMISLTCYPSGTILNVLLLNLFLQKKKNPKKIGFSFLYDAIRQLYIYLMYLNARVLNSYQVVFQNNDQCAQNIQLSEEIRFAIELTKYISVY